MKKLDQIIFSTSLRQTGKTELLRRGVDNYDRPFILVCKTIEQGRLVTQNPNCIYVTPKSIDKLRGRSVPIIFDQEWVLDLLKETSELQFYKEIHSH